MNELIKNEAKATGIKLWQIAGRLGFTDSTFSRKLRKELAEDEKEKILLIIKTIQKEGTDE